MEKKGDILNQFAIISDLLEKSNIDSSNITIFFQLNPTEFERIYEMVYSKAKVSTMTPIDKFQVKIGDIFFHFSMYNA